MGELINLKKPRNTNSGVADKVLIALVEWFAEGGIKSPGPYVNFGDAVVINEDHEFLPGKGFIECSLAPEKNFYNAKSSGEIGFQKFENNLTVVIPGSYDQEHDTIKELLNKPVIALIQDSTCFAGFFYQVGSECVYAYISPSFSTGTTKEGQKAYTVEILNRAKSVLLYKGGTPATPDPLIAIINGSIEGSTVSLDALDSIIYGAVHYKYTVYYRDDADVLQTVELPEDADTAEFDTSILVGWNAAGFAVKLSIWNDWDSDETHTSDSTGQRPYVAGGFDNGFDDGFDFNINI